MIIIQSSAKIMNVITDRPLGNETHASEYLFSSNESNTAFWKTSQSLTVKLINLQATKGWKLYETRSV